MICPLAIKTSSPTSRFGSNETEIPARTRFPNRTQPEVEKFGPVQNASPITLWCSIVLFELI